MNKKFRWGIFGTGAISVKFLYGLAAARNAEAVFVASRNLQRAQIFARQNRISHAIQGYEEAAAFGGVDAIYIATPPALHAAHALMCIQNAIPVLIEKPFSCCLDDAKKIVEIAKKKSVFVMEGLWTRFLPAAKAMREKVLARDIGDIRFIQGDFGISQVSKIQNPLFDPRIGGGALSHLSPYPLSLAQWLFGRPEKIQAIGIIGCTGVDEHVSFQMRHANGVLSSFSISLCCWSPQSFSVLGSEGMICFRGSIVRPHGLAISHEKVAAMEVAELGWRGRLRQNGLVHSVAQRLNQSRRGRFEQQNFFYSGNGYHYQADEVRNCVWRGAYESTTMSLGDSLAVVETTDSLRKIISKQENKS